MLQLRIFKAHETAKGPLVTAVKRALPTTATPGDLATALRDARRPVSDAERTARLTAALTPKAVTK